MNAIDPRELPPVTRAYELAELICYRQHQLSVADAKEIEAELRRLAAVEAWVRENAKWMLEEVEEYRILKREEMKFFREYGERPDAGEIAAVRDRLVKLLEEQGDG